MDAARRTFMRVPRLRVARRSGSGSGPAGLDGQHEPFHCLLTLADWARIGKVLDLAPRELELVQSLCRGERNSQIAKTLGIAPATVHTYLDRLYRKLGVHGRTAAALCAVAEHLKPFVNHQLPARDAEHADSLHNSG